MRKTFIVNDSMCACVCVFMFVCMCKPETDAKLFKWCKYFGNVCDVLLVLLLFIFALLLSHPPSADSFHFAFLSTRKYFVINLLFYTFLVTYFLTILSLFLLPGTLLQIQV